MTEGLTHEQPKIGHGPTVVDSAARSIVSSSERNSMARKRYQRGHVYLDGDKWKGRFREDVITAQGTAGQARSYSREQA